MTKLFGVSFHYATATEEGRVLAITMHGAIRHCKHAKVNLRRTTHEGRKEDSL